MLSFLRTGSFDKKPTKPARKETHDSSVTTLKNTAKYSHALSPQNAAYLKAVLDNNSDKVMKLIAMGSVDKHATYQDGESAMWLAAERGHTKVLSTLIELECEIDATDNVGTTPLWIAAQNNNPEAVECLAKAGADVNLPLPESETSPLWIAAQEGHARIIKILARNFANVNRCNKNGSSPIWVAAQNGHLESVKMLALCGAHVDTRNRFGATPLFIAAQQGHVKVVNHLLDLGASPEASEKLGQTPLYVAVAKNHREVVQLLAAKGANVNSATSQGVTPLLIAAELGLTGMIDLLGSLGAELNSVNQTGASALFVAAEKGHVAAVDKLLRLGIRVNICDNQGHSALYAAAWEGRCEIVELIGGRRSANLDIMSGSGLTPLCVAAFKGHVEVARMLYQLGADPNAMGSGAVTPLWTAAREGHLDVAKVLVEELHADVNLQCSPHAVSAIWIAAQEGKHDMVRYLASVGADLNMVSKQGATALHIALLAKRPETFRQVLTLGGQAEIKSGWAAQKTNLADLSGLSLWLYDLLRDEHACFTALCLFKAADRDHPTSVFRMGQTGTKIGRTVMSYLVAENRETRSTMKEIANVLGVRIIKKRRTTRIAKLRDITSRAAAVSCFSAIDG